MSVVKYNNKRLIPAPFISINKKYDKAGDGSLLGSTFNISLVGTIVTHMGSPTSSGSWWTGVGYPPDESVSSDNRLKAIQTKQDSIRDLFSDEGKLLVIQSPGLDVPVSGFPRINDIDFSEGQWYDRSQYTVNLELDRLYPAEEDSFTHNINSAEESWQIETNEGQPEGLGNLSKTYRLTHTVAATGKRRQDGTGTDVREAWAEARNWVHTKLGQDSTIAYSSGVLNLPSYYTDVFYNHTRNENINKKAGSYSVTENWILASGAVTEDLNISTNLTVEDPEKTVRVEGTITGLETGLAGSGIQTTKYENASSRFVIASGLAFTRAQNYSGISLNLRPFSATIGKNPIVGIISYSFVYNNRPSNLVAGARSEIVNVADSVTGGQSFAEIFVLERSYGPILQDLGTRPSFKRNLSIELVMDRPTVSGTVESIRSAFHESNPRRHSATSGNIENIINAVNPQNMGFSETYSDLPQENWNFLKGRYSYNQTWTYVPSG